MSLLRRFQIMAVHYTILLDIFLFHFSPNSSGYMQDSRMAGYDPVNGSTAFAHQMSSLYTSPTYHDYDSFESFTTSSGDEHSNQTHSYLPPAVTTSPTYAAHGAYTIVPTSQPQPHLDSNPNRHNSPANTTTYINFTSSDDDKGMQYESVMNWLNQQAIGGTSKRKRKITRPQRAAANSRERRRMNHLNGAFEVLREAIPMLPNEKKLSRIQTLRLAIDYISFMDDVLKSGVTGHVMPSQSEYHMAPQHCPWSWQRTDTTKGQMWLVCSNHHIEVWWQTLV